MTGCPLCNALSLSAGATATPDQGTKVVFTAASRAAHREAVQRVAELGTWLDAAEAELCRSRAPDQPTLPLVAGAPMRRGEGG